MRRNHPKEKGHPPQTALPDTTETKDTSSAAQRQRILERLRKGSATTIQLRRDLDVIAPAQRIFELRHDQGCEINMRMVSDETKPGHKHTVALYSLVREANP